MECDILAQILSLQSLSGHQIDGTILLREEVKCGVPQGSILGSLLFTMYVNDLPSCISHANMFIYADDTAVVVSDSDPVILEYKLNNVLGELHNWFTSNKLSINIKKTDLIFFGTQPQLNITKDITVFHQGTTVE